MSVGFFGAAFVAVRHADSAGLDWATVEWNGYVPMFLIGAVGVVLLRVTAKRAGEQVHKLDSDLQAIRGSLGTLVDKLHAFNVGREAIGVYDVHDRIDNELVADLGDFVDAREALITLFGLQEYAELMNHFALSERNINRAWSASADGYIDEVSTCMARAEASMREAQSLLQTYEAQDTTSLTPA